MQFILFSLGLGSQETLSSLFMEIYLLRLVAGTSGRKQEMLTVANGEFQSVNELLQGTSGQYRRKARAWFSHHLRMQYECFKLAEGIAG